MITNITGYFPKILINWKIFKDVLTALRWFKKFHDVGITCVHVSINIAQLYIILSGCLSLVLLSNFLHRGRAWYRSALRLRRITHIRTRPCGSRGFLSSVIRPNAMIQLLVKIHRCGASRRYSKSSMRATRPRANSREKIDATARERLCTQTARFSTWSRFCARTLFSDLWN